MAATTISQNIALDSNINTAAEIRDRTELVLQGRFAQVQPAAAVAM